MEFFKTATIYIKNHDEAISLLKIKGYTQILLAKQNDLTYGHISAVVSGAILVQQQKIRDVLEFSFDDIIP